MVLLTVVLVDHLPTEYHRYGHDHWAHRVHYPNHYYPMDPRDLKLPHDDDCCPMMVEVQPVCQTLRPMRVDHSIGDYYVAELQAGLIAERTKTRTMLSAVEAVGRRPIHLIVQLSYPNPNVFFF